MNTIVVAMTGFSLPDDNFIEGIAASVDNLETLVQSGMNMEVLQETLRWIASVPSLRTQSAYHRTLPLGLRGGSDLNRQPMVILMLSPRFHAPS